MSDPEGVATATRDERDRPAPAPGSGEEARDETGEALARAVAQLRDIGRDALDLLDVTLEKARLGVRSGAFRLLLLSWLALAAVAATVLAVYLVVQGVSGGLAELLGGRIWAGRLAAGLLVLAALAATALAVRGRARRANLERLRRKYAERAHARGKRGAP